MDKFRKALLFDVRLMKRDVRNHLRDEEEYSTYRAELPDAGENARWLNQQAEECSPEEVEQVEALHKDGWSHMFQLDKN